MRQATHVEILGVKIPLRGLEFVTCMPRSQFYDAVADRMNADMAREMLEYLKTPSPFEQVATRKVTPIDSGVRRQFFTYAPLQGNKSLVTVPE